MCRGKKGVNLSALGMKEDLPDLDVLAIKDFVARAKADNRFLSTKIGIVGKAPKKRNEFRQLVAVAMCRDVDAVALLNESEMHCSTLICVMCEDGVRSCAVSRGKVMVDADGIAIADLGRAGINDVFVGVSTLLCLLGPATVVVVGDEAPSVIEIIARIKDLVPAEIMVQSVIRNSIYGEQAVTLAASKLHFLNQKFRINS